MTDHKFTHNEVTKALERCINDEVIKALEHCINAESCCVCGYTKMCDGTTIHKFALALIMRQKAEITRLITSNSQLEARVCEDRAVIEKLSDKNKKCIYLSDDETNEYCVDAICPKYKSIGQIKAEAIKEFAEAVKMEFYREFDEIIPSIMADKIDKLVKEMTEIRNDRQG